MKHFKFLLLAVLALALGGVLATEGTALAAKASLKGRIVYADDAKTEIWYVHPSNGRRYLLSDPAPTFALLKSISTQVSDAWLAKPPKRGAGKIVRTKSDPNRLWYIHPDGLKKIYVEANDTSFAFFKGQAWKVDAAALKPFRIVRPQAAATASASTPVPPPVPATVAVPTPSSSSAVSITGFAFPKNVTVAIGTTVTWTNNDPAPHTITSDTGAFGSSDIAPGGTYSHTFTSAGTFPYHCEIHPSMQGTITVQ